MEFRHARKSMLGSRRSNIGTATYSEVCSKKFELIPKNLQVAETLRKQRTVSNNENSFISTMKTLTIRQPRKSMLGTRNRNRDSIIPPAVPDVSENHDSSKIEHESTSSNHTIRSCDLKVNIDNDNIPRIPSLEDDFMRRDSVLRKLPEDVFRKFPEKIVPIEESESPVQQRNVPIREMSSSTLASENSTFIENETLLANEESILATTLNDTTVTNENSVLGSTLKNESIEKTVLSASFTDVDIPDENSFTTESNKLNDENTPSATRIDTTVRNRSGSLGSTFKDITNCTCVDVTNEEATLIKDPILQNKETKKQDDDMLFKMLDLMNTWMRRTTETIESYQNEIAALQKKVDAANEEIEDMKNLKQTLIKQFSINHDEKENLVGEAMATIVEEEVFKSPAVSPTKTYLQEMRSTIKFMKTPLTSRTRAPRASMLLTPHSMSFSLKNQYEQLFE